MLHYRQAIARTSLEQLFLYWSGKATENPRWIPILKNTLKSKRKSVPPVKSTVFSTGKIVCIPRTRASQPASQLTPLCWPLVRYTTYTHVHIEYRIFSFCSRSSSSNFVRNQPDLAVEHVFVVSSVWLGTFHLLIKWTGAFFSSSLLAVSNCFFSFSFHVRSFHYWFLWDNLWLYF